MKRVACYARVSSDEQHPEAQTNVLDEYCAARGLEVFETYVDHGVSGTKEKRPALDRLLADAHRRRFDAVVVVAIDRLARSVKNLCQLCADFDEIGVGLVFLTQQIDTSCASGKFLMHTLSAVAELEASLARERTIAGLAAARRRGVKLGGRKPRLDRAGVGRARRMRAKGDSIRAIAQTLDISVGTAHSAVRF